MKIYPRVQWDQYFLDIARQKGIQVEYVMKLLYNTEDEEELTKEFDLLKSKDVRIILTHIAQPVTLQTWYRLDICH